MFDSADEPEPEFPDSLPVQPSPSSSHLVIVLGAGIVAVLLVVIIILCVIRRRMRLRFEALPLMKKRVVVLRPNALYSSSGTSDSSASRKASYKEQLLSSLAFSPLIPQVCN